MHAFMHARIYDACVHAYVCPVGCTDIVAASAWDMMAVTRSYLLWWLADLRVLRSLLGEEQFQHLFFRLMEVKYLLRSQASHTSSSRR